MHRSPFFVPVLALGLSVPAWAQTPSDGAASATSTASTDTATASAAVSSSLTSDSSSSGDSSGALKQKDRGLIVSLGFSTRIPIIQLDGTSATGTNGVAGTLFAGYKLDRYIFGLGFSVDHVGVKTTMASPSGESTQVVDGTSFLISPGAQIAALRAAAGRLELYGSVQFGLGRSFFSRKNNPELPGDVLATYDNSNFHLNYQIGPGLRFYFIPQFALQLTTGLQGDHYFASQDTPTGRRADNLSNVSFFGNLGLLGVF